MSAIEDYERAHLAEVLACVEEAVDRAHHLAARMTEGHREAGVYLASARGELSPEEAHLSAFELNRMDQRAAVAHESRQRLEKLLASPYFARVDFVDDSGIASDGDGRQSAGGVDEADVAADSADDAGADVAGATGAAFAVGSATGLNSATAADPLVTYIGRFAFTWKNQALVSDWRSPVAGLFYDFEPGPASFEAPGGQRVGTLTRKRQVRVEDGELVYAVDSDSSVRDEVLAHELSRTSDGRMRDIVASIQREQNAIIRDEEPGTLVIQGVAGSGKTSIALHRIAYLLYRQKERLTSQSVAILSPSRVFSDYISGVLPELGEEPVHEWSLHDLARRLLEGVASVQPARSYADEVDEAHRQRAQVKSTKEFSRQLSAWLDALLAGESAEPLFQPHDVTVGSKVVEGAWLAERFASYGSISIEERLDIIAGDARAWAEGASFGRARGQMPTRRELRGRLMRMLSAKTPLALYKRFLAETAQSKLFKSPAKGVVEWEDAFPLVLCRIAFQGPDFNADLAAVRHLVIDEMQDLSPVQHEAISRLFRCDKTILGDVNQLVDDRDSESPEAVAGHYPGARLTRLMRSYRSSFEVTELARRVKPIAGLVAVQRHGDPVRVQRCGDTLGVLAAVDEAVAAWRVAGRRSLGIICKSELLAARYAEVLRHSFGVTLLTDDADEFPPGIVVSSVRLAKGLEFDEVVILDADSRQYATEADRNLLYVAITRAMHRLTVLYRDEPSPFLG